MTCCFYSVDPMLVSRMELGRISVHYESITLWRSLEEAEGRRRVRQVRVLEARVLPTVRQARASMGTLWLGHSRTL